MDDLELPENKFGVGLRGEEVVVLLPPRGGISKDDAVNLAAWLVALANPGRARFEKVFEKVMCT